MSSQQYKKKLRGLREKHRFAEYECLKCGWKTFLPTTIIPLAFSGGYKIIQNPTE